MKQLTLLLIALFFGLFLVWPLLNLLGNAFFVADLHGARHFTLSFFALLGENALYRTSLLNSFEIATLTTLATALISVPLALLFTRMRFPGRDWLQPLLLAPLILPPFVGALGIKHLFARFGTVNLLLDHAGLVPLRTPIDWLGAGGFSGIVILEVLHLFPILTLSASAALAGIDSSLLEAAANLGAGPWRRFRTITLPLARPGIFGGACLVFIGAFTDLGTPLIFNFSATVPTQIFTASVDPNGEQVGNAFVITTLALVFVFFLLVRRFGQGEAMSVRIAPGALVPELAGARGWLVTLGVSAWLLLAILPHLGVLLTSFADRWFFTVLPSRWSTEFYRQVFTDRLTAGAVGNSLLYSGLSAVLDLVLGLAIAHLLTRTEFRGKAVLDAFAMLPLALPGIVHAFALLETFNLQGAFGWINPRNNPVFLIVVAYALRRLPYMVRAAHAGYQQSSVALEEASASLGAGRWRTFTRITLPLLAPSLLAGLILTFCFAMLEVSDSLLLAMEARFAPITRAIYEVTGRPSPDSAGLACALGVLAMGILAGGLFVGSRLMGRRLGSFFRA
jgi:iron(III) transport system permease protein